MCMMCFISKEITIRAILCGESRITLQDVSLLSEAQGYRVSETQKR